MPPDYKVEIRVATADDIPDIADIHVAGWQGSYGGIVDQDYLDSMTVEMRIEKWTEHFNTNQTNAIMAYVDDKPAGFADFGALKTAPKGTSKIRPLYSAEIYAIYLKPEFFRAGIGTALLQSAVEKLKIQKHQSLCLWVLDKNKRGCGFYEKMGGQRVGNMMIEIGPNKLKEVCYAWRDINEVLKI